MRQPDFQSLSEKRARATFPGGPAYQPPQPIHYQRQESPMTAPMTIQPKPAYVDPQERADAATILGIAPSEVLGVQDHPHGTVIDTGAAGTYILVPEDRPDALGQTGLLIFETGTWHPVADGHPMQLPAFADPNGPAAAVSAEKWTLAELIAEGERLTGNVARNVYPEILASGDPRRLMGLLTGVAKHLNTTRRGAVTRDQTAAQAWDLIVRSGWLAEGQAEQL